MGESRRKFKVIGKLFVYLIPLLGLLGLSIPLIVGYPNLSLLGSYLAIPMILAPIIYLKHRENNIELKWGSDKYFSSFVSAYFLCISVSIILTHISDYRKISYFIIVVIMATIILLEICTYNLTKNKIRIILLQIMILSASISWGVTLNYDFFISRTDPLVHVWYIKNLLNISHVTDVFYDYKPFPLWHILCASIYEVIGFSLPTQKVMFFTNGLVYSFMPVIIYSIVWRITDDQYITILSSLFTAIYPEVISYGMSSIPRSVVSFLFVVLILCLLDSKNSGKIFLSFMLVLSLILYHPASMPFILSLLLAIWVLCKLSNEKAETNFLSLNFIIMSFGITLFYLSFYADIAFRALIFSFTRPAPQGILTSSIEDPQGTLTTYIVSTSFNELFNYLQYSIILYFIIIGFLLAVDVENRKTSNYVKIFCIIGLLTVALSFPGPLFLINKIAGDLNIFRFGQYSFLFIGLTAAIGFSCIYQKSNRYSKVILIMLFSLMVLLCVTNDFNASDNPLIKRPFYTFYITSEERMAFDRIASFTNGFVMSDLVVTRYLSNSPFYNKSHILEIDYKHMEFLKNSTCDILLIRTSELSKRPLSLYSSQSGEFVLNPSWQYMLDYYYQDLPLWDKATKYNKIYNSKNIIAFN